MSGSISVRAWLAALSVEGGRVSVLATQRWNLASAGRGKSLASSFQEARPSMTQRCQQAPGTSQGPRHPDLLDYHGDSSSSAACRAFDVECLTEM
jgi:hypothetical protein